VFSQPQFINSMLFDYHLTANSPTQNTDFFGKIIKKGTIETQYLDFSTFKEGIYIVELGLKKYKVVVSF
jgi:hypothetical protein